MKNEDYERVVEVFRSAARLSPKKREEFLERECGTDTELRREVERLLSAGANISFEEPDDERFKDLETVSEEIESEPTQVLPGSENLDQFGNYKVISRIGKGGMGEVFLARDLKLDRKVALKVLPEQLTKQERHLQRFKQEALAASALNHPYILTIFEFGENEEGKHYIVSEFVEGKTLNKFAAENDLTLSEKLDISIGIASALAAAHQAGIIHRDIKPDNIIVRPDGLIKVLDFGLAKLVKGQADEFTDSRAATHPLVETMPGVIMGTAGYMSPEQAKGKDIDERTDVFSFGILLYELVAECQPFEGDSAMDVIASILHKEPPPLDEQDVPAEITHIIEKALKKDRRERYGSMREMLFDLKDAKSVLASQDKLGHTTARTADEAKTLLYKHETTQGQLEGHQTQNTFQNFAGGSLVNFRTFFGIFLLASASVLTWWLAFGFKSSDADSADDALLVAGSLKPFEITNWANAAGELSSTASFSPDARFVAYGSTKTGTTSIWVKQTRSGDAIQVTKDEFYNRYPVWSPNGDEVVYYSKRGDTDGLWRVSLMGGQPKLVAGKIDNESKPRFWSKNGRIYFQGSYNLFAADDETGEVAQITDFPTSGQPVSIIKVSPDESRIAYLSSEKGTRKIFVKRIGKLQAEEVFSSKDMITNLVWHPGGEKIFFSQKTEGFYQIFSIAVGGSSNNASVQISSANSDSFIKDISTDGARILFDSVTETSDLWRVEKDSGKETLVASEIDAELWADVSPAGDAVVYQSIKNLRQGSNLLRGSIVLQTLADKSAAVPIAEEGFLPQWSPDGKTLAFLKLNGQGPEIWRVAKTGDSLKPLVKSGVQRLNYLLSPYLRNHTKHISWSPDGSALAFSAEREGISNIWLVSADGSSEKKVSANLDANQYFYSPIWSPDGKRIVFASRTKKPGADNKRSFSIWWSDLVSGRQNKLFESEDEVRILGWSADGGEIIFAEKMQTTRFTLTPVETPVRAISIKTDKTRELAILKNAYFYNIHLSPDSKALGYTARENEYDDVWILSLNADSKPSKLTVNNDSRLYYSSLVWSPDGSAIFFGKQTRFTLLSMLINTKITEEKNETSNE